MWSHVKGVWKLLLWGNESSLSVLAVPGVGGGGGSTTLYTERGRLGEDSEYIWFSSVEFSVVW